MQIAFKKNKKAGFTLVELLVVLGIISAITLLLLVQQSKFDSSTVLRSLAYGLTLSVRQAQVYGLSVKESPLGSNTFAKGYGLYFSPSSGNQNNYIFFADISTPPNQRYDVGEETSIIKINNAYSISEVCVIKNDGVRRCSGPDDTSGAGTISSLTILFKRPNPDAVIIGLTSAGVTPGGDDPSLYTSAYIQIRSTAGSTRGVHVYSTGQVSVDAINPPTAI